MRSVCPVACSGVCQVRLTGNETDSPCVGTVDGPLTVPAADLAVGSIKGYLCHVADGLWCDDASHRCSRSKGPGAACASFGECGAGNYCDDGSGKCAARKREGAACAGEGG